VVQEVVAELGPGGDEVVGDEHGDGHVGGRDHQHAQPLGREGTLASMSVTSKRQLKPGQAVAVLHQPDDVELDVPAGDLTHDPAAADAVLLFAADRADLDGPGIAVRRGCAGSAAALESDHCERLSLVLL
jgi:hypothetical protein